jgi:hypothetical protein
MPMALHKLVWTHAAQQSPGRLNWQGMRWCWWYVWRAQVKWFHLDLVINLKIGFKQNAHEDRKKYHRIPSL